MSVHPFPRSAPMQVGFECAEVRIEKRPALRSRQGQ